MSWYLWLKWLHILSSTVLFGTGLGIAFFFVRAQQTSNVPIIASVARDVVLADMLFTATAVIVQPVSGMALALVAGYSLFSPWLLLSFAIYFIVGACWLRVVLLQIWMRDMAIAAAATSSPLPIQYKRYYRQWFALGWPAFVGVMAIFYLMVAKPSFAL
jgi:uncharacterized membrane protein